MATSATASTCALRATTPARAVAFATGRARHAAGTGRRQHQIRRDRLQTQLTPQIRAQFFHQHLIVHRIATHERSGALRGELDLTQRSEQDDIAQNGL